MSTDTMQQPATPMGGDLIRSCEDGCNGCDDCTDYADCDALVAAGLMTKRSGGPLSGGDPVYRVTDAGQDALVGRQNGGG